jgi:hypothetical protein
MYALLALALTAMGQGNRRRRPLEPILLPFDLNRDSKISRNEMAAAIRHLDTDGDSKVSPREMVGPGQREFDSPSCVEPRGCCGPLRNPR